MILETGIAEYLLSVPGIGVITASSFLGEVGDPSRFTSPRQIIKLAGLNIAANSSGKHQDKTKITKRGRSYLRKVIYLIARTAVTKNQQIKTLHSYFLGRKVNPLSGMQSLIAIGNKMVRILWRLSVKKECYDPEKALGDFRSKQLEAA